MESESLYTFENEIYRKTYWHTVAHILAQAVKRLYPETKLAIGPAIDNGFYYDFDAPVSFSQEDLTALEKEMKKNLQRKTALGKV
jgi:threonyl-tRNA synthetase